MTKFLPLFILICMTLTACGAASLTRLDSTGGRIALQGRYMPAMSQARLMMAEQCEGRFEMREQRESVSFLCRNPRAHQTALLSLAGR